MGCFCLDSLAVDRELVGFRKFFDLEPPLDRQCSEIPDRLIYCLVGAVLDPSSIFFFFPPGCIRFPTA